MPLFLAVLAPACDGQQAVGLISGVPIGIPGGPLGPHSGQHVDPEIGISCGSGDANHLCFGLKYVVYADSDGRPVVSDEAVESDLVVLNMIWSQCDLGFQIDELLRADPIQYGLRFNPSESPELDAARSAFAESNLLLVITTGTWDRAGTLGQSSANAWTVVPGGNSVMGAVLEKPVGTYPNILAHELGHYLGLDHVSDDSNVMNPIIYGNSTRLRTDQCDLARMTALYWWQAMLRS